MRTQSNSAVAVKHVKPAQHGLANSWIAFIALMAVLCVSAVSGARGAPDTFADLAERLSPAVVNISTTQTIERRVPNAPPGGRDGPFGEFWDEFRERFGGDDVETREATSLGSGFIIGPEGFVVTNNHVIADADTITVILVDGTEFTADVVGTDQRSDLALLKIERDRPFPFVTFGDSEKDRIGDWVMAIGNPFGLGGSVTAGIISGRNRPAGGLAGPDVDYIQTDAPINRGNSGGPLFNLDGDVIGVNSAILSPSGGNVGIGFAIPSNYAKYGVEQLKKYGKIRRSRLGVFIDDFTEEAAESLGIEKIKSGILVSSVQEDSPAEEAGVEVGDIIYRWDGKRVENTRELRREVAITEIGKSVEMEVIRDGESLKITVVTGELVEEEAATGEDGDEDDGPRQNGGRELIEGMELSAITPEYRERFNIDEDVEGAVVLRVSRRSNAYRVGIRPGVVIQRVNQQEVASPQAIVDAVEDAREAGRDSVLLLVRVPGGTRFVVVELEDE